MDSLFQRLTMRWGGRWGALFVQSSEEKKGVNYKAGYIEN